MEIQNVVDHLYATVKSGILLGTVEGVLTYVSKRYRLDGKMITNVRAAQLIEAEARRLNDEADKAPVLAGEEDGDDDGPSEDYNDTWGSEEEEPVELSEIDKLLLELRSIKNGDRKKVIRAKLRKLGYKLSDQK
jgi:hypothetical protein